MRYVRFDFHVFKPAEGMQKPYVVRVQTDTPNWVFINRGESLLIKLDGQEIMRLTGDGSLASREIQSADSLVESATYRVSREDPAKIGNAKVVEFRIVGAKQEITGKWRQEVPLKARWDVLASAFFHSRRPWLAFSSRRP